MDAVAHRMKWYVWGWNSEGSYKIPHNAKMRGTWGWDAECSCGWQSHTGGATRGSVERYVWQHKYDTASDADKDRMLGLTPAEETAR